MLSKQDIGKFYVSLPRGSRGEFIKSVQDEMNGSYSIWRNKFTQWAKGKFDRKPLSENTRRCFEMLISIWSCEVRD